jgi:hypothetical protein
MIAFDATDLRKGDCLLYFTNDLFGWITAIKTWSKVSHVEVYRGEGMSVASRNGIGVNTYPLRTEGLVAVRRPIAKLNMDNAGRWFQVSARFQGYDWFGLLNFYIASKHGSPKKMFCSEFATRYYRHGAVQPFDPDWDADRVPPSFFLVSPAFETIWSVPDLY